MQLFGFQRLFTCFNLFWNYRRLSYRHESPFGKILAIEKNSKKITENFRNFILIGCSLNFIGPGIVSRRRYREYRFQSNCTISKNLKSFTKLWISSGSILVSLSRSNYFSIIVVIYDQQSWRLRQAFILILNAYWLIRIRYRSDQPSANRSQYHYKTLSANRWFKTDEISMATAIGSTGDLFGLAIGFLIPPFIVKTPLGTDKNIHMPDQVESTYKQGLSGRLCDLTKNDSMIKTSWK